MSLESIEVVAHQESGPYHRIIRFKSDSFSQQAQPGHSLSVEGGRWPIWRSQSQQGWLELIYPLADEPTSLAELQVGERVNAELLSQDQFLSSPGQQHLLLADSGGLPAILYFSLELCRQKQAQLALFSSDDSWPFKPHPSQIIIPELPGHVIATIPILEQRGIACRLIHSMGQPGCFDEDIDLLAQHWLEQQRNKDVKLYSAGSKALGIKSKQLAENYSLTLQFIEL